MAPVPAKPLISVSDLEKVDIRVGTVRQVEDVPNSDKLVKLVVGFGDHERSILACLVSEGMLFDIGYADGMVPVLAIPEQPVPDGSRAG